jgi:hypothetical protein
MVSVSVSLSYSASCVAGVLPGRDFPTRLVQLGFHFVGQFKLILEVIIDPLADLFNFLARQFWNRRLDFFDRAHSVSLSKVFAIERRNEETKEHVTPVSAIFIGSRKTMIQSARIRGVLAPVVTAETKN